MSKSTKSVPATPAPRSVPRQLSIAFNFIQLPGMNPPERAKAIACLLLVAGFLVPAVCKSRLRRETSNERGVIDLIAKYFAR